MSSLAGSRGNIGMSKYGRRAPLAARFRQAGWLLAALLSLTIATPAAHAAGKVYALIVADSVDESIGADVMVDVNNLRNVVYEGFVKSGNGSRIDWTVLDGERATPDAVMQYYENLQTTAEDTIFFYYSGHGIMVDESHYLGLNSGAIPRSLLRGAMNSRPHGLALLVTDCCASYPEVIRPLALDSTQPAEWSVLEKLFFTPGAMVDVNASSPGQYSWSNPQIGGFFSSAFTHALTLPASEISGANQLDWSTLISRVDRLVDDTYHPEQAQRPYFFFRNQSPTQWYEKTLVIENGFTSAVNVQVSYLTLTTANRFEWFTPNLYWTVQPGEAITLMDEDFQVRGAAFRVYIESADGQYYWGDKSEAFLAIDDRFGYAAPNREYYWYSIE